MSVTPEQSEDIFSEDNLVPQPTAIMPSGAKHVSVKDIPATEQVNDDPAQTPAKTKRVFTRADIVRSVPVKVVLPFLYEDFEPWVFDFRLKFSQDAEERRQEYLALVPSEQTLKLDEQNLDEVCDLMISTPQGFGDLQDTGQGPGASFKSYVQTTTDPVTKDMLMTVVKGAISLYWRKISPQEFRA